MKIDKKFNAVCATALVTTLISLNIYSSNGVINLQPLNNITLETEDLTSSEDDESLKQKEIINNKKNKKKSKNNKKKTNNEETNNSISYTRNVKFNVSSVGNPLFSDSLYRILQSLPEGIKDYLYLNNLKVIFYENENGAEEVWYDLNGYDGGSLLGFTHYEEDDVTIFVEASMHPTYYDKYSDISKSYSEEEFNYILVSDTFVHELGHFIDHTFGFGLSNSNEFYNIYQEELENYMNTIEYNNGNLKIYANINTTSEYFASAYACYILYPDNLKELCPNTYTYIDNIMNEINKQYYPSNIKTNNNYALNQKYI